MKFQNVVRNPLPSTYFYVYTGAMLHVCLNNLWLLVQLNLHLAIPFTINHEKHTENGEW